MKQILTFITTILIMLHVAFAKAPDIVVSIRPIHSIVANITAGVTEPKLILENNISVHDYHLKPSNVMAIENADVLIYVSRDLETFLNPLVNSVSKDSSIVELSLIDGINLLKVNDEDAHEHAHEHGKQDMHIWLDIGNMKLVAGKVTEVLSKKYPEYSAKFKSNNAILQQQLDDLDTSLKVELSGLSDKGYIVYHNALQYFENRYGLTSYAAILERHDAPPSAAHLRQINQLIKQHNVKCIFTEFGASSSVVNALTGEHLNIVELDPAGASLTVGSELYFNLMKDLGSKVAGCVG